MQFEEPAPAKINLALHVRVKLADGRHAIETVFAFCTDGDRLAASPSDDLSLTIQGQFAAELGDGDDNLVLRAAKALRDRAGVRCGAELVLTKNLPVASGVGGGSADAAAALRLLTRLWNVDPAHASAIAPGLGSDVPACLLSLPARGQGAGDQLTVIDLGELSGAAVLLLNPRVQLSTAEVFANWSGEASGPLGDWRDAGNDLEEPATRLVPLIGAVLAWLSAQPGVTFARMSGSGATCFALFESKEARDNSEMAVPREWWRLSTYLR
jgi:4-diphosphocytidyl-2-C-methyl-D-erythritol kinase